MRKSLPPVGQQRSLFEDDGPADDPFILTKHRAGHGPTLIALAVKDVVYENIAVGWARDIWRLVLQEEAFNEQR